MSTLILTESSPMSVPGIPVCPLRPDDFQTPIILHPTHKVHICSPRPHLVATSVCTKDPCLARYFLESLFPRELYLSGLRICLHLMALSCVSYSTTGPEITPIYH